MASLTEEGEVILTAPFDCERCGRVDHLPIRDDSAHCPCVAEPGEGCACHCHVPSDDELAAHLIALAFPADPLADHFASCTRNDCEVCLGYRADHDGLAAFDGEKITDGGTS